MKAVLTNVKPSVQPNSANIKSFDQTKFTNIISSIMSNTGYVYAPSFCQTNVTACGVHVVFHGCQMNYNTIGNKFIVESNLNGYAEANNVIVIYPQAAVDFIKNPEGCWDWWGYTGSDYALKSGKQMSAVYNMAQNVEELINSATEYEI